MKSLKERIWTESIHGTTGQVTDEGWLEAGAIVRDVVAFDESYYCDPSNVGPEPKYAQPDTWSFLASTDGGKKWFRQRSNSAPILG